MNRIAYGKENALGFVKEISTRSRKSINSTLHKITKKCKEKQFLNWSLNRYPTHKEMEILSNFFFERKFIVMNDNPVRTQYRKFLEDQTSVHISLWKKHYGFNIEAHIDLKPHEEVEFNEYTLRLLSELYVYLNKKYGIVFLLPRQRAEYQGYVSSKLPQERVDRKKNRPKRKLR